MPAGCSFARLACGHRRTSHPTRDDFCPAVFRIKVLDEIRSDYDKQVRRAKELALDEGKKLVAKPVAASDIRIIAR